MSPDERPQSRITKLGEKVQWEEGGRNQACEEGQQRQEHDRTLDATQLYTEHAIVGKGVDPEKGRRTSGAVDFALLPQRNKESTRKKGPYGESPGSTTGGVGGTTKTTPIRRSGSESGRAGDCCISSPVLSRRIERKRGRKTRARESFLNPIVLS